MTRGRDATESDADFAGGTLKSLDRLIHDPASPDCWRDRLALKAAALAARISYEGVDLGGEFLRKTLSTKVRDLDVAEPAAFEARFGRKGIPS